MPSKKSLRSKAVRKKNTSTRRKKLYKGGRPRHRQGRQLPNTPVQQSLQWYSSLNPSTFVWPSAPVQPPQPAPVWSPAPQPAPFVFETPLQHYNLRGSFKPQPVQPGPVFSPVPQPRYNLRGSHIAPSVPVWSPVPQPAPVRPPIINIHAAAQVPQDPHAFTLPNYLRITAADIQPILAIHRDKSFDRLKQKLFKQHEHNCWSDAFFAFVFQSDKTNEQMASILQGILLFIIEKNKGTLENVFSNTFVYELTAYLISHNLFNLFEMKEYLEITNFIRYTLKLIQIHKFNLRSEVLSPKRIQSNQIQALIKSICGLPPRGGFLETFMYTIRNLNGKSIEELNPTYSSLDPKSIYAYWFFIFTNGSAHAVSVFKSGNTWYFYDNEGIFQPLGTLLDTHKIIDFALTNSGYLMRLQGDDGRDTITSIQIGEGPFDATIKMTTNIKNSYVFFW
jgi:hypothetical protein